jgi:hypothetical protein
MFNSEPNNTFKSSNAPTPNNQIMAIRPYWDTDTKCWVFDDKNYGLVAEPFVLGMSEIIDQFLIDNQGTNGLKPRQAFTMLFAKSEMPGTLLRLDKLYEEYGGCWYEKHSYTQPRTLTLADKTGSDKGWLCAALFHYFDEAPDSIFISATE